MLMTSFVFDLPPVPLGQKFVPVMEVGSAPQEAASLTLELKQEPALVEALYSSYGTARTHSGVPAGEENLLTGRW